MDVVKFDLETLPKEQRIALALKAHEDRKGKPSLKKAAKMYSIGYSTLRDRKNSAILKAEASQAMQRLSPVEEEVLRDWILKLAS